MNIFAKISQYPTRVKILLVLYIIIFLSLTAGAAVVKLNQKQYFSDRIKQGRTLLTNKSDNSIILGKINTENIPYKQSINQHIEMKPKKEEMPSGLLNHTQPDIANDEVRPKIALIIGGLGLNKISTLGALETDKRIALGFSPYGNDVSNWITQAVSKGYKVFMNIPMQTGNYPSDDPGPLALLNNLSSAENLSRLELVMAKSDQLAGIYSDTDEVFTNSVENTLPIFKALKQYKLSFIYGGEVNNINLENLSENTDLDYINVNILIDEELDENEAKSNLLRLENMAKVRGFAVGKFHPYPMSINLINNWIQKLESRDIMLVPITDIFELKKESIKEKNKNLNLRPQNHSGNLDNTNASNDFVKVKEGIDKQELSKGKIYTKEEYKKYYNNPDNVKLSSEEKAKPLSKELPKEGRSEAEEY